MTTVVINRGSDTQATPSAGGNRGDDLELREMPWGRTGPRSAVTSAMGLESSAINEMVYLAANAKALWSADAPVSVAAPRQPAHARRSPSRVATMSIRSSAWRVSPGQVACMIGLAMIGAVLGLTLRGDGSPVVGTAAAAAPAPARTMPQLSTITVTPIDVPTMTVTPIDLPAEPIEMLEEVLSKAERKQSRALRIANPATKQPSREEVRKPAIGRRAKVDVSKCVDSALGCMKVESTAAAVAQTNVRSDKSSARKAKRTLTKKSKKRFRGMTSADEEW